MYASITFPLADVSLLFLVDCTATYSEISLESPHFPSGDRSIQVVWINFMLLSFLCGSKLNRSCGWGTHFLPFSWLSYKPIGERSLVQIKTTILCIPSGMSVNYPQKKHLVWLLGTFWKKRGIVGNRKPVPHWKITLSRNKSVYYFGPKE